MERDRKDDPNSTGFAVGFVTEMPVAKSPVKPATGVADAPSARLMPAPEKGMSFPDALDDAMREHHNVFAALAK